MRSPEPSSILHTLEGMEWDGIVTAAVNLRDDDDEEIKLRLSTEKKAKNESWGLQKNRRS